MKTLMQSGRRFAMTCTLLLGMAQATAQSLTVAVAHGPVSLPMYVAEAKGHFEREGLKVQALECSSGRACFQLLAQGDATVATASELVVTLNSFKRSDLRILGTLSTSSHQIKLVARRSAGIRTPADVAGKRLASPGGTSAGYFLDSWLIFHGADPSTQKTLNLEPQRLAAALVAREVDAIAIWEPIAASAVAALGDDAVLMPNPRVYTQHFTLVTDERRLTTHSDDLQKLVRALLRAERFIADDPAGARAVLRSKLGVSEAEARAYMTEHDFRLRLDQSLISTMEGQARWAVRSGQAEPRARPENFMHAIEPALLRKASPAAVTLVQ